MRLKVTAILLSASPLLPTVPLQGQSPGTDIFVAAIEARGAELSFSGWINVTARPGYDNQPGFAPDSDELLYTSQRDGQTDIYRVRLGSGVVEQVTRTPESEYSATVMPGGRRFSAIRVEADSTQRLWSFARDGSAPRLVLTDIAPVGYHAWITDDVLALFVLGRPSTLRIADRASGSARIAAHDIGRSLHRVPGRPAVSFLHQDGGQRRIRTLDVATGGTRTLARPLDGSVDYAWTPNGLLLMGSETRLYALDPLTDSEWRLVADLAAHGITSITRLAVSPDGRRIAVVAADP